MNRHSLKIFVPVALFALTLFSCGHHDDHGGVLRKIEAGSKDYKGVSVSSEKHLGDTKMIQITEGDQTFLIPERKSQIRSYACTECHTKPIAELHKIGKAKGKNGEAKNAHWDISLKHADANTMNCATCHDGQDMNQLKSLTGKKIDFNKSYRACAQCHTKQFQDWKGGAHGKRIGGWAPPRASKTCVNCHNPHKPHFESRWPARFNTQKVKERK
ncbi:hypothetical protein FUAX_19540 [Fulvitalea axinellae]|uniref:Cytochrome C n=1 Tax=Fulvitalea axinellae TaxID=1182444 RepID=A0AAU9CNJ7_9BACT|nr:hypothetical protein FUAX_19540 [Fulvitalea axinellae]